MLSLGSKNKGIYFVLLSLNRIFETVSKILSLGSKNTGIYFVFLSLNRIFVGV